MKAIEQAMYRKYAKYYDLIYSHKDYKKEAKKILELISKYKKSDGNTLLEFACGTGMHMQYFAKKFRCTGVDLNKGILSIAKKRIPGAVFKEGNMANCRLGKRFDVVLCLFSSIGYVKTYANLRRTIRNFARHLKKGGVVIIDPWFTMKQYTPGSINMATYDSKDLKIARLNMSERKGIVSILDMHFLVAEKNKKVIHFVDRHELGMFEHDKTLKFLRNNGIAASLVGQKREKHRSGRFVGIKQ
jgi:ubiquinone/menaquinone biosynthesis C-methylase UbiE